MICGSINVSDFLQEVVLTAERKRPVSGLRYNSDMRSDPADWPTSVTCSVSALRDHLAIGDGMQHLGVISTECTDVLLYPLQGQPGVPKSEIGSIRICKIPADPARVVSDGWRSGGETRGHPKTPTRYAIETKTIGLRWTGQT
jgi:hypothetical protein